MLVGIVEPSVRRAEIERARRKRPENLDAYDLYLRAVPHTAPRVQRGDELHLQREGRCDRYRLRELAERT